jgi:hypothetical protein
MKPIVLISISDKSCEILTIQNLLRSRFQDDTHLIDMEKVFHKAGEGSFLNSLRESLGPALVLLVASSAALKRNIGNVKRLCSDPFLLPFIAVALDTQADRILSEMGGQKPLKVLRAPMKPEQIVLEIARVIEEPSIPQLTRKIQDQIVLEGVIGKSEAFLNSVYRLPQLSCSDRTVLLTGETGTGKEVIARAIHGLGVRQGKPFIPVNCGGLATDLLENELFGHRAGAYTNAADSSAGLVQEAEGETLFFDEIGELSAGAQGKLLRFLQDKEFRQLGSPKAQKADVRVIAATNVDLKSRILSRGFREDLYYRISALTISIPPLRERGGILSCSPNTSLPDSRPRNRSTSETSQKKSRPILKHMTGQAMSGSLNRWSHVQSFTPRERSSR